MVAPDLARIFKRIRAWQQLAESAPRSETARQLLEQLGRFRKYLSETPAEQLRTNDGVKILLNFERALQGLEEDLRLSTTLARGARG